MKPDTASIKHLGMTSGALAALEDAGLSRRGFLKRTGALIVTFSTAGGLAKLAAADPDPRPAPLNQVDSWIVIRADETVLAYSGKCDFGQGFGIVQYQLVAEELSVPLERVQLTYCDTFLTPDQGVTSGSQSHLTEFGPSGLRQALATARDALFQAAAQRFSVSVDQLTVKNGVISVKSDASRQVSYGQLIGDKRFSLTLNAAAVPKDPHNYTILGTAVPRYDVPGKVLGTFEYVQNVRLPGMLHGKVIRPPAVGAKLMSVNESSVRGLPGNVRVVTRGDFVGVVADTEYRAIQAARVLEIQWSKGSGLPNQDQLYDWMRQQPTRDAYTVLASDVDDKLKQAARVVSATYRHPYQMHGSLASSCAVADVWGSGSSGHAKIWSATQGVYPLRDTVATVLGIPGDNIRVRFVEGSGCYGINGADTVSVDAALLSNAVQRPVRVQFTRRDEMADGENYGPAYVIDLRAGLDDKGQIITWDNESWTLSKGGRPNGAAAGNIITGALVGFPTPAVVPARATPPTAFSNNNNAASSYSAGCVGATCGGTGNVFSERILTHTIQSPFFTGPLRSPARLQNTFANESFIDELAAAVKADPVQYRLRHLTDTRLIDVLNGAAKAANWDTRPSPKAGNSRTGVVRGRGIAAILYEGNNGYCALVAEVEVDQASGTVAVKRLVAAADSGPISNPNGLRNQMEGGALQGMSRALNEEVTWNDQAIMSNNWRTYPVYQFGDPLPVVETVLINRLDKDQMGAGETTITIAGAAIANAIYDATGTRIRQIPFTSDRVLAALKTRG